MQSKWNFLFYSNHRSSRMLFLNIIMISISFIYLISSGIIRVIWKHWGRIRWLMTYIVILKDNFNKPTISSSQSPWVINSYQKLIMWKYFHDNSTPVPFTWIGAALALQWTFTANVQRSQLPSFVFSSINLVHCLVKMLSKIPSPLTSW